MKFLCLAYEEEKALNDLSPGEWKEVRWTSEVTGLGEGTKATGLLQAEAQTVTLAAVGRAFGLAAQMDAPCAAAHCAASAMMSPSAP